MLRIGNSQRIYVRSTKYLSSFWLLEHLNHFQQSLRPSPKRSHYKQFFLQHRKNGKKINSTRFLTFSRWLQTFSTTHRFCNTTVSKLTLTQLSIWDLFATRPQHTDPSKRRDLTLSLLKTFLRLLCNTKPHTLIAHREQRLTL